MKTVFVDTNIILDVLLQNEGFWQDSFKIFKLAETGAVRAYVSASSMTDIFYIVRKKLSIPTARNAMSRLLKLFEVVGIDGDDLKGALTVPIDDMEDALQAWCARKINADALITRDTDGFPNLDIPVISPVDYKL